LTCAFVFRFQPLASLTKEISQFIASSAALAPLQAYGSGRSLNIRRLSPSVTNTLTQILLAMPTDPRTVFAAVHLRGSSASPKSNSFFGSREEHIMTEYIAVTASPETRDASVRWADESVDLLRKRHREEVLKGTYINIDMEADAKNVYTVF